jgi:hypothetical protein
MFPKWLFGKQKSRTPKPRPSAPIGPRLREPRRPVIASIGGRPPIDADRDFVYHER